MYEYVLYVDVYMSMTNLKITVTKMCVITVNLLGKAKGMKMVAIKDMEMPKACVTYTSENDNYTSCPFYKICEQRETIKTNYKPTDCPLVEIEERKVGYWRPVYQGDEIIDYRCSNCDFGSTFGKGTYGMNYCNNCGSYNQSIIEKQGSENG